MTYSEAIEFLFAATPNFQQQGAKAYKPGLERVLAMASYLDSPHTKFPSLHIAGTNGKGSVSSTLASVLQSAGYKVGLFTSPHLVDFRERIRINGLCVSRDFVIDFVEKLCPLIERYSPSFFEITTLMAFYYFATEKVDIAVVEVGLGGRLDATNILSPLLSVITNISRDHTQFLGSTLSDIAFEKAGIIKRQTPIVIGEVLEETRDVFLTKSKEEEAPIFFAQEEDVKVVEDSSNGGILIDSPIWGQFKGELSGAVQVLNAKTVLAALRVLKEQFAWNLSKASLQEGFSQLIAQTHLLGRWQKLAEKPRTYCDTGHNEAGISYIVEQLKKENYKKLHILFGMVSDKEWKKVLALLPKDANYYFVAPLTERALAVDLLQDYAKHLNLKGSPFHSIKSAYLTLLEEADEQDFVYIGGSNYVVSELIKEFYPHLLEENIITK